MTFFDRQLNPIITIKVFAMFYQLIPILSAFLIFSALLAQDLPDKNNLPPEIKTLTKNTDVTGDSIPDLIILKLYGSGWDKPITWQLTIKVQDSVIFQHHSDDAWLDAHFAENGFVADCEDYLTCKKKYYETDILSRLIVVTDLSPNNQIYGRNNPGSIYVVARKELINNYHISEIHASQIMESMISRLKNKKAQVLCVPISPVQTYFPIMFVPEVKAFITMYNW